MACGSGVRHASTVYAESSDILVWLDSMRCGCREASELRSRLARAAEALEQLEGAVRTLHRSGKEADAEGVQEAILQVGWPSQPAGSITAWACLNGKRASRCKRTLPWMLPSSVGHNIATMLHQGNEQAVGTGCACRPTSRQLQAQVIAQLSVLALYVAMVPSLSCCPPATG